MTKKQKKELFLKKYKEQACNITKGCEAAGISRQTYYDWLEQDKRFNVKTQEVEESLYDFVESMIVKKMKEGDSRMLIHYSKTKMKSRGYVEKHEFEHTGFDDIKISFTVPYGEVIDVVPKEVDDGEKERVEYNDKADIEASEVLD